MKKWLPSFIFLSVLWLLQSTILPVVLEPLHIPRLVLAGVVVLAVIEERMVASWFLLLIGLWMDMTSGFLAGTYTVALLSTYFVLQKLQKRLLPTSYRYLAVMGLAVLASLTMDVWILVYSWLTARLGWPISLESYFALQLGSQGRLFATGGMAFVLYLFWQELSFILTRPIVSKRK